MKIQKTENMILLNARIKQEDNIGRIILSLWLALEDFLNATEIHGPRSF